MAKAGEILHYWDEGVGGVQFVKHWVASYCEASSVHVKRSADIQQEHPIE